MDQRRPRLGDVVDDYCTRERRLTNHAVVAMLGDDIKQTRCTTCDAEHVYKGAKVPPARRKKDETGVLRAPAVAPVRIIAADEEAEGDSAHAPASNGSAATAPPAPIEAPAPVLQAAVEPPASGRGETIAAPPRAFAPPQPPPPDVSPVAPPPVAAPVGEDGRMRRSLIRATLPRPEGQQVTRPVPEFTMRTPPGRNGGNFRGESRPPRGPGKPGGAQRFAKPQGAGGRSSGNPGNPGNFGPSRGTNRSPAPAGPRRPPARHGKKRPKN